MPGSRIGHHVPIVWTETDVAAQLPSVHDPPDPNKTWRESASLHDTTAHDQPENLMRIGIFGGAFDPVHNGHLLLAEQCREQCELDEVWFVPTRVPPHKPNTLSPGRVRVEMLELATAGILEFLVKRIELDRDDVSWTVDTLRSIRESNPDDELFLLIGGDTLNDLRTWREPEAIANLATIVAVNRSGIVESEADAVDASLLDRVRHVTMPGVALSATAIRDRVRAGRSIRFLVPRAVEQLIRERKLYAVQETPS